MDSETSSRPPRTLLKRGLAMTAAALGLGATHRRATESNDSAPEPPRPATGGTLRLYGRGGTVSGSATTGGSRSLRRFELLDRPDGTPVGEFFASGFLLETAFGPPPGAASNIELHTFRLGPDTLFGIGAPAGRGRGERTHALLGGTGRFTGARGSYVERPVEGGAPGRGHVEFIVTLVG